jgi:hypothetical protein
VLTVSRRVPSGLRPNVVNLRKKMENIIKKEIAMIKNNKLNR